MIPAPFIPPRTRAELASTAPRGQRHEQMKKIILPLLGAGLTPQAVFAQLRSMYDSDVSDKEISDLISWGASKNPQACGNNTGGPLQVPAKPRPITAEQARANVERWLGKFRTIEEPFLSDESSLWHASPWRPLEDWKLDSLMLLAALYGKDEHINIVTDFTIERGDGKQKANPRGAGKTLLRDEWMRWIRDKGTPESKAGAWIRFNPVKKRGSGKAGAITDADVTSYRFTLLESDLLSDELQLSLWSRLPLPIAAIISSGGKSSHAWVKLDCVDATDYRSKVERIYTLLARFGVCQSNKNASRLSRLPGAQREIGKHDNGEQRLFYLNPDPIEAPIFARRRS